jgi:ABC-type nitrate/sulfonate/bicarbonate transport system ATPase subunit
MEIKLERVSLSFGEKRVLENFSMRVGDRDRIAIMGPSGSGKTTILRLLAGLIQPDEGMVTGVPANGVSFVFQENRLLSNLSVLGNILLVSKGLKKATATQYQDAALRYLDEVGLRDEAYGYPAGLSGGMERRVAVVRAVAFESPLLLLDEPFSGLDELYREKTAGFITRHCGDRAIVISTHDREEAELLGAGIIGI